MSNLVNKKIVIYLFLLTAILLIANHFYSHNKDQKINRRPNPPIKIDTMSNILDSTVPSITLMCRLYHGSALEFYNQFLPGYHIFWPKQWKNSELTLIFDEENEIDHRYAVILGNLPPYPNIYFEKRPSEQTFCSDNRREGYSRQQYSNFYSDLYSDKEYIGIIDTDSFFVTPVTPDDLFINGKPRIIGYNGILLGNNYNGCLKEAIGYESIGEFMVVIGFPVLIKREHFKPMRELFTKNMKAKTFEEAWFKMCSKYKIYSQFDIIVHYLWFYKRDEYSWHFVDAAKANHKAFRERATNDEAVLRKNEPLIGLMKHGN